jgi:hypothetical protein
MLQAVRNVKGAAAHSLADQASLNLMMSRALALANSANPP